MLLTVCAVLLFGSSAVLVLYAEPVTPIEKTCWRLMIAAAFVYSLLKLRREKLSLTRANLPRFALYGLITALHFGLYVAALSFTTAAHALTIVYTSPIFVALCSAIFLNEKIAPRRWIGIGIAAIGVAVLAGFEPRFSVEMLIGDGFALGSAVMFGFYSVAGRRERHHHSLFSYAFGVYALGALWLLPLALWNLFSGGAGAYGAVQILAIIALGLFPLGIGHTLYNASLRLIPATFVNIIATQEVTFGVLLTWLLLGQVPSLNSLIGAVITLVGVLVVLL